MSIMSSCHPEQNSKLNWVWHLNLYQVLISNSIRLNRSVMSRHTPIQLKLYCTQHKYCNDYLQNWHDDVIKWKHFPCYWPFVRGIHRSPVFHVFFDLRLNKPLSKQSWGWWFETLSRPLWRHCNRPYFGLALKTPPRMISPSCWFRRCLWWLWENLSCCKRTVLCLCHEHIYRVRLKNTCTYSWVIYNPMKLDFIMIIVDGVLWEFVSLKVTISMNELYIIT